VTFPEEVENSAYPIQLKQELVGIATNLAGIGVSVSGFDQEPYYYNPDTGSNMPYNIHIKGYNFEKLMEVANNLKRSLLTHRRIKDCEVQTDKDFWWGGKEKYFSLKLDREKLDHYRIPPVLLRALIEANLRERTGAQRIKFDDKELSIEIKTPEAKKLELDDLLNMELNYGATPFRLKDVVDIEFTTQKGGITREDQEYWAMVQWDYLGSAKSGDRFHKTVYKNLQVPVGFSKSLEERRFRLTEEEDTQLWWAIWASLGLIFLILGMLFEDFFQPILIILAIPLALIGVFLAFWKLEYSFDASARIGVILLMGIVVNNAILLIDNINRHLRKNKKIIESIATATKERIRPILMTSLTTVLGMLPLILFHETGSRGDIWTNLALCTIGGLTTSALLILFVLPIFYYLFYKLQRFIFKSKEENAPLAVRESEVSG
jgi:HAE1 family hydrophobic/amphiphilic exporter-1